MFMITSNEVNECEHTWKKKRECETWDRATYEE